MSKEITKETVRDSFTLKDKKQKKDKGKAKIKTLLKGDLVDYYDTNPIEALLGAMLEELQKVK